MAKTKTKTITLDQLLRIREDLENSIRKDEQLMYKNNSRPKDEEKQIDFKEIKNKYELKLSQLIEIKEAIRNGNAELTEDKITNDKNIYLLSNLNRRKAFLNSLNTFQGKRKSFKDNKIVEYKVQFTDKNVEDELINLEKETREIETKLSDFNHKQETTVELYNELALI